MFNTLIGWVTRRKIISFVSLFTLILSLGFTISLRAGSKTDKIGKNKSGKLARQQNERGDKGEWIVLNDDPKTTTTFKSPVVASHVSLLPNGKLLAWGPTSDGNNRTTIQIWDPNAPCPPQPPNPMKPCLQEVLLPPEFENLYCSGHSFLPDGRLVITGGTPPSTPGSSFQSGLNKAAIYDYASGTSGSWTPLPVMNGKRWYPTNLTLPSGGVLVWGGYDVDSAPNKLAQVLEKQTDGTFTWRDLNKEIPPDDYEFRYYTWLNMLSSGKALVTVGVRGKSYLLTVGSSFQYPKDFWYAYPQHSTNPDADGELGASHDSGSTIVFDKDQMLAIGGGECSPLSQECPTGIVEKINLNDPNPQWQRIVSMSFPRRHHNSTILPDGKVLVTGGNKGDGFNNTCPQNAVKVAEMWDPAAPGIWKPLAAASEPRIYHSSALLLPDARVFTGGTTYFQPDGKGCLEPVQHNFKIEIFSPPYLFNTDGTPVTTRPEISLDLNQVSYDQLVNFTVSNAGSNSKVNLVRLPSVTHSFNQNQGFYKLAPTINGNNFSVRIPANRNELVPGHYMMFVVNGAGVPSKAKIIQVL